MANLVVQNGPNAGTEYTVDSPKIRLGRHPECEVIVDSGGSVSRFHAEITDREGNFYVEDSGSRNGTFVNNQMIKQPQRLFNADRIQICDLVFVFHDARPESRRPSSAISSAFPISAVMVEHSDNQSSIMSRLEVSSQGRNLHVRAGADVKLKAMMELADNLANSLSVEDVLAPALDSLFKIFLPADQGFIVLGQPEGQWQCCCTRFRHPSNDQVKISRSIIEHVMTKQEAILSHDASDDSRFDMSESIANFRIRSFMCAPLIDTTGNVLGAIQIDAIESNDHFREEDLELMVSIASQAAIAIQRAQLHDEAIKARAIQSELDLARTVQLGLLPESDPDIPTYEFFNYYKAANKIGGDFYTFEPLPDGRIAIMLADVSGHGVAAAMVMVKLATEVRVCLATTTDPATIVGRLNQLMCTVEDLFVTMVLAVLNPESNELEIVVAGHDCPLVRKSDGSTTQMPRIVDGVRKAGVILGMSESAKYDSMKLTLDAGESVVVFTDGIPEAENPEGNPYQISRIIERLTEQHADVAAMGERIINDLTEYRGTNDQADDICLVCVRRKS
ncbi:MAG: SpoIIE family protein phosphatase [Planctomycetota bacterium]